MNEQSFVEIVQNAALLLALVLIFDTIAHKTPRGQVSLQKVLMGGMVGAIGIGVMLTPWVFAPGVVFDVRSVLLGISGIYLGTIPTLIAMLITSIFRVMQGGGGASTGVLVILITGLMGIGWRFLGNQPRENTRWRDLYLFGLISHIVMLGLLYSLPNEVVGSVLKAITLPVLVVYPLGTALLGKLMTYRLQRERVHTELRQNEEQLRQTVDMLQQSEEKYRLLTENIKDVVWIIDTETMKYRYISPSVARLLDYTPEEFLSQSVTISLTPQNYLLIADRIRSRSAALLAGDETEDRFYTEEVEQMRKDGSIVWTEVITSYYRDPRTGRVEVRGVTRDISDRKQAQEALRESSQKLELLFDLLPVGVSVLNRKREVLKTNSTLKKIMGFESEDLQQGAHHHREYYRPDGSRMPVEEFASSRVLNGAPQALNVETGVLKEDGNMVWTNVSAIACDFSDWDMVLVTADITARKEQEARLTAQLAELRRWHNVILDREDRILDLKREVNELSARLNQPRRYSSVHEAGHPPREITPDSDSVERRRAASNDTDLGLER